MVELNLVIIWEKARYKEDEIIADLKSFFTVYECIEIEWDSGRFHENLTRFYGQKLPKGSKKEKHCGNGAFHLIIFGDENPIYDYRSTSRGPELVNVNVFDRKTLYREWTGGGHKVHTTNGCHETAHDLMLLLGKHVQSYDCNSLDAIKSHQNHTQMNLIGADGWSDLQEMFNSLNGIVNYVVMRNYEELPHNYKVHTHGDIDILTDDRSLLVSMLNARKSKKLLRPAAYEVIVSGKVVPLDIRTLGDNYYCEKWQSSVLNKAVFKKGVRVPTELDHRMMLVYHALFHKVRISNDYFNVIVGVDGDLKSCVDEFKLFMRENSYEYVTPSDISVYFNYKNMKKHSINYARKRGVGIVSELIRVIRQLTLVDSRVYLKQKVNKLLR